MFSCLYNDRKRLAMLYDQSHGRYFHVLAIFGDWVIGIEKGAKWASSSPFYLFLIDDYENLGIVPLEKLDRRCMKIPDPGVDINDLVAEQCVYLPKLCAFGIVSLLYKKENLYLAEVLGRKYILEALETTRGEGDYLQRAIRADGKFKSQLLCLDPHDGTRFLSNVARLFTVKNNKIIELKDSTLRKM